jgi:hypothetical protein
VNKYSAAPTPNTSIISVKIVSMKFHTRRATTEHREYAIKDRAQLEELRHAGLRPHPISPETSLSLDVVAPKKNRFTMQYTKHHSGVMK